MTFAEGYKIRDESATHFVTFTVVDWVDAFSRRIYKDVLVDSLRFCQNKKGLVVNAYVIMTNHAHLILSARDGNLSDIIRDLKKYTSRVIIETIKNEPESRKTWMLHQFAYHASKHSRNDQYQFWTHDNHPEEVFTEDFFRQKLRYIHENPVRAGYVFRPEDYIYSSAAQYSGLKDYVFEVTLVRRRAQVVRDHLHNAS